MSASVLRHGRGAASGRDALVVGGRRCTYAALTAGVEAAAACLLPFARGPQPRAGILLEPGPAFFEAFLGAGAAGMAAMVLQQGWSDRELGQALAAGGPAVVLARAADADRLAMLAPAGCTVVTVGGDGVAGGVAAALARAVGAGLPDGVTPLPAVTGDTPFYVGFTSGTTGRPKGFVRSHASWLRSFEASAAAFGITAADGVLAPGPLDHSLFLYAAVHGLSAGATVHLQRRFAPGAVLAALGAHPITRVYLVPTMLAGLLRAADRAPQPPRLEGVTSVICSGARWPVAAQERVAELFCAAEPVDFYGASELSFVSLRRLGAGDPPDSVGRPFPGVEVSLRRADGTEAGLGERGTLWVRSGMLFSGYLEPGAGGATRDADGWVTVGDVAHRDAEGRLYLDGREQAMLVCGGTNVYPEEIEAVLCAVPGVAEAVVVGLPDDYWGDLLCAVVRWQDGRALPRRGLREHCRERLARGKRPQRWLEVDDFPRTSAGKVARAALARALREGMLPARELR